MKLFKSIVLAALAVFLVVGYINTPSASAQSSALSIAPKKNYIIEPGEKIKDRLTIRNLDNKEELKLYIQVVDFTYTDDTGTPKLMLDQDAEPTTWSLRSYLKVPESVTVRPNSSASVDMSVAMPEGLGAGSYYSAIMYSTTAPDGGNVGLAASGVTLAFVTVPGSVNENLLLQKFGAYKPETRKYTNFTMDEPHVIAYTLENKGNVVEAPVGSITLKGWFGQEYKITDINPSKSLALIGQARTFQSCIKLASQSADFEGGNAQRTTCVSPGLWPGYFSLSVDMFYGQNGNLTKEITKSGYFWYLPLWFVVIVVLALLAVAYYVWRTIVWMRGGSFKLGGRPQLRKSSRRRR